VASAADHNIESSFLATNRLYRCAQYLYGPDIFFDAYARENGVLKADPLQLVDKLGERYEITLTNIKQWTVGLPIQAPLDAVAGFFKQRSFTAATFGRSSLQIVVVRLASDEVDTVKNCEIPEICLRHLVALMFLEKTRYYRFHS